MAQDAPDASKKFVYQRSTCICGSFRFFFSLGTWFLICSGGWVGWPALIRASNDLAPPLSPGGSFCNGRLHNPYHPLGQPGTVLSNAPQCVLVPSLFLNFQVGMLTDLPRDRDVKHGVLWSNPDHMTADLHIEHNISRRLLV